MEMSFGKKELKRRIDNFIGMLTGSVKCAFCSDRSNWKEWIDTITVRDANSKQINYELPICAGCFVAKPLDALLSSVDKNIAEYNEFCQSFGAAPAYRDADRVLIRSAIKELKNKFRG